MAGVGNQGQKKLIYGTVVRLGLFLGEVGLLVLPECVTVAFDSSVFS